MSSSELPLVTIGMPFYNSAWSLPKVLEAIYSLDYPKDRIRIVFVDNSSTDGSPAMVERFAAGHQAEYESVVIKKLDNPSIPVARNICLEAAGGAGYVFFVDADVIVPPETLGKLLVDFSKGKNVGMTSVPCDYENAEKRAGVLYKAFRRPSGAVDAVKVGAGCTMISAVAIRAVGGYNEKLKVHEDAEYCFRIKQKGFSIICDLSFRAFHLRQITADSHYYLNFMLRSSMTYVQMLKLRSSMHYAKVISSVCVTVALLCLFFLPRYLALDLASLTASALFAFWSNLSKRVMDDGSSVRKAYWPIVGVVMTPIVVVIVWLSVFRLAFGSLSRSKNV